MKFRYVIPTLEYKERAIDYIKEFKEYGSNINGVGGLDDYLDDYEGWLEHREECRHWPVSDTTVPGEEFFLVNEDDEIIGMCNIRFTLNDRLKEDGGHIGYSIRPTKRGNDYNKVNLYLALKECDKQGIEEVMLTADIDNIASWKTMEALGGKGEVFSRNGEFGKKYFINVKESLKKYKEEYERYIYEGRIL